MRRMLDIVTHPKYAENKWVYFDYAKAINESKSAMVCASQPMAAPRRPTSRSCMSPMPAPLREGLHGLRA